MKLARLLTLVLLTAGLGGCSSLSLKGQQVRSTRHESEVADCRFIQEFTSWDGRAATDMKNQAAELGGDVVLFSYRIGRLTGKAYDCGGRYKKTAL
jgi:hypothetical protein